MLNPIEEVAILHLNRDDHPLVKLVDEVVP